MMKKLFPLVLLLACNFYLEAQAAEELKSLKGWANYWLRDNSVENESIAYWNDGTQTKGLFIYESNTDDIPWMYVDMYRFIHKKKGKARTMKLKFKKLDSLLIGDDMFRFMDVKAKYGLMKIKRKRAIYKVLADFDRTQVIRYMPHNRPLTVGVEDNVPMTLVHNKETDEFFQMEDNGLMKFSKRLSKYLSDCSEAAQLVLDEKASDDKRSLLKKALADDSDKNMAVLKAGLEAYDNCK